MISIGKVNIVELNAPLVCTAAFGSELRFNIQSPLEGCRGGNRRSVWEIEAGTEVRNRRGSRIVEVRKSRGRLYDMRLSGPEKWPKNYPPIEHRGGIGLL